MHPTTLSPTPQPSTPIPTTASPIDYFVIGELGFYGKASNITSSVQTAIIQTMVDTFSFLESTSDVTITSVEDKSTRRHLLSTGNVLVNYELSITSTDSDITDLTSVLITKMETAFTTTDDDSNDCTFQSDLQSNLGSDSSTIDCAESYTLTQSISVVHSPTPSPTPSPKSSPHNQNSQGTVIGASVGAVAGFLLLVAIGWRVMVNRQKDNGDIEAQWGATVMGPMHESDDIPDSNEPEFQNRHTFQMHEMSSVDDQMSQRSRQDSELEQQENPLRTWHHEI